MSVHHALIGLEDQLDLMGESDTLKPFHLIHTLLQLIIMNVMISDTRLHRKSIFSLFALLRGKKFMK